MIDVYEQKKKKILRQYEALIEQTIQLTVVPSWKSLQSLASNIDSRKDRLDWIVNHLRHECSNCHATHSMAMCWLKDWCETEQISKNNPWMTYANHRIMSKCKTRTHDLISAEYPSLIKNCNRQNESATQYAGDFIVKYGPNKGSKVKDIEPCELLRIALSQNGTKSHFRTAISDHLFSLLMCL